MDRIDVVYVRSNADLAKQNLSRLNVTGQKDIIESGRLTHASTDSTPHWIHPGAHKIERRLLDHPLSRDVPRTKHMLDGLAKYRLTLGQARQDDLLGLIKDGTKLKPLDLRP